MEVRGIATRKLHCSEIIDIHIVEVSVDMVAQLEVVVGIHNIADAVLDIVIVNVAPSDRHGIHGYNTASRRVLIAERTRQTQYGLNISLGIKSLADTIVGCCETAEYVRRILPSKH